MTDDETNAQLRELLERQKSMEQRLEDMSAAEQEMAKTYAKADDLYRRELAEYNKCKYCGVFRVVVPVLALLFLIYIAYRVS